MALPEGFGFVQRRVRGSHHIFRHPNAPRSFPIQPRPDGKAKPYQIQQFLKLIEKYDLHLDEDGLPTSKPKYRPVIYQETYR